MSDHDRTVALSLAAIAAFCAALLACAPGRPQARLAYPAYCENRGRFPAYVPCAWLNPERRT